MTEEPDPGLAGPEPHRSASPAELPEGTLDLYKLAVEMADRISVRRGTANSFFLTVNTAIVGVLSARSVEWYLAASGITLSLVWLVLLRSYRDLNRAKFTVILGLEQDLPIGIYTQEWAYLRQALTSKGRTGETPGARLARFRELGAVEPVVPIIFALIYVAEILRQAVTWIISMT